MSTTRVLFGIDFWPFVWTCIWSSFFLKKIWHEKPLLNYKFFDHFLTKTNLAPTFIQCSCNTKPQIEQFGKKRKLNNRNCDWKHQDYFCTAFLVQKFYKTNLFYLPSPSSIPNCWNNDNNNTFIVNEFNKPSPLLPTFQFFLPKNDLSMMLFDLYKSNKRKNKTIGNKVNSLITKPYSVSTELTSGKKQLWFGLKPSWIDFIGFDMITMLKLIIPLKEHYYNSFIWLWKKSMLSSKNKNFQKKRCKKTYYT